MTKEANAKIHRINKKIDPSGSYFEINELIVEGDSLKDVEEIFDKKWS